MATAADQAAKAVTSVEGLVGGVISPMKTLLKQLKTESDFMKAVTALLPQAGAAEAPPADQTAAVALVATIKDEDFQAKLQAAYTAVDALGTQFKTPVASMAWGGSRRKRIKRRASTRGFYHKKRY